jgi:hypothetical protein
MTTLGITGHRALPQKSDWDWVADHLRALVLATPPPLKGISSLAVGVDQLFASIVLEAGGILDSVIPFEGYDRIFSRSEFFNFQRLRGLCATVEVLERVGSDEECYLAAGRRVVDLCDQMLAVWNGRPAEGLGGTADIVAYAVRQHKRIVHLNPVKRRVTEA